MTKTRKTESADPAALWDLSPQEAELASTIAERGLRTLMEFCLLSHAKGQEARNQPIPMTTKWLTVVARRFVAVAWLLHSEMLQGDELDEQGNPTGQLTPLTLQQLGELPQLGCTKVALSLQAKAFSEQYGFHARVQKRKYSKGNDGSYAAAAKTGWVKRRAREAAAKA